PGGGTVQFLEGLWTQGTNNLTIGGAGSQFIIGGGAHPAIFRMDGGTLSMTNGDLDLNAGASFQVNGSTVTVANGTGAINFNNGSSLQVGLGAINQELIKVGSGD